MLESLKREVMVLGNDLEYDLGSGWTMQSRRKDVNMDVEGLKGQNVGEVVFVVVRAVTETQ